MLSKPVLQIAADADVMAIRLLGALQDVDDVHVNPQLLIDDSQGKGPTSSLRDFVVVNFAQFLQDFA